MIIVRAYLNPSRTQDDHSGRLFSNYSGGRGLSGSAIALTPYAHVCRSTTSGYVSTFLLVFSLDAYYTATKAFVFKVYVPLGELCVVELARRFLMSSERSVTTASRF